MEFTLNGKPYNLTAEQVVQSVQGVPPPPVKKYGIKLGRKTFPIKEALSHALGIPPAEFTSQQAYGILQRLGFTIETTPKPSTRAE